MKTSLRACIGSILYLVAQHVSVPAATFQPIPFAPQLTQSSVALGVSADGSTVVGAATGFDGTDGFRWTLATGTIPQNAVSEFSNGVMYDVSGNGSVAVGALSDVFGPVHGYRWLSNGTFVLMPNLPNGTLYNEPLAITDSGAFIVG